MIHLHTAASVECRYDAASMQRVAQGERGSQAEHRMRAAMWISSSDGRALTLCVSGCARTVLSPSGLLQHCGS